MKKSLALLLALVLVLCLLAACGKDDADNDYTAPTHATQTTQSTQPASDGDMTEPYDTLPASGGDLGDTEYPASDGDLS